MLNSVDRYCTPKICATSELVSGTVPSHVNPRTIANSAMVQVDSGSSTNAAIATARSQ